MYTLTLEKLKTKKYIIQAILFFIGFMTIYQIIDSLNLSYQEMAVEYGTYLVVINLLLNIIMSILSALLMHLSTAMVEVKGKEGKGSALGFISVLFGILTYGCTPCVIAFFASIGIAFSVIALPLAGLPYKFVSLILILLGHLWLKHEIEHAACKVNFKEVS